MSLVLFLKVCDRIFGPSNDQTDGNGQLLLIRATKLPPSVGLCETWLYVPGGSVVLRGKSFKGAMDDFQVLIAVMRVERGWGRSRTAGFSLCITRYRWTCP
jgi:hypothetical protein